MTIRLLCDVSQPEVEEIANELEKTEFLRPINAYSRGEEHCILMHKID